MRIITVARKPLSEKSVAANVLKHGCGGLNIDASRISGVWSDPKPRQTDDMRGGNYAGGNSAGYRESRFNEQHSQGRWPANLILSHLEGCECAGTRKVKGHQGYPNGPGGIWKKEYQRDNQEATGYTQCSTVADNEPWEGPADEDGKETVANWICAEGCPVRALDEQSGTVATGTWNRQTDGAHPFGDAAGSDYNNWKSVKEPEGGASRFFKQVK